MLTTPDLLSSLIPGIDALLSMLRSLNEKVGTYDEEEEFQMLEQLLQSSHFKKAKDVSVSPVAL